LYIILRNYYFPYKRISSGIRSLVIIFNTIEEVSQNINDFNPRFYEWKLLFTVLTMTSELNSVFDQIVHIILFKRMLNWGITFARATLKRPQTTINDNKYMINFISPTNDSTNSKRKRTIREFFRWDICYWK